MCLVSLGPQVNILYTGQLYLPKILDKIKYHVNINRVISVVLYVASMTYVPVPMVYALNSRPVSYSDRLETNMECRLLDMRIWWCLTTFAVSDRTVDALVWQIWHERLVNLSRHYKTCSAFFRKLHWLGYRWHYCVSSLSLMVLHTRFLTFCGTSTSFCTQNKVTINMALTCMIFYM